MSAAENKEELIRIMSVDDSRLMRKAVARILKGLNDVVEAEHGEDAWDKLQQDESIRIVCCDLSMPIMDGFGFLEKVRNAEDERIRSMPVIIVTGQEDSEENRNKIFEAGASDFVSKPFDSAQLRACIQTHTKLALAARELKKKEDEFEDVAAVDPLTGLGTRAFFYKSAEQAVSFAKRHDRELVVIHLQIDNMRQLFLKIGKGTSNALIKKVGEILAKNARQEDMICRMGLDGFTSLLMTHDLSGAVRMVERVREMVASVKIQSGVDAIHASISAGVVKVKPDDKTTVDGLLEASGKYLTIAQKDGGNKVSFDRSQATASQVSDLTVEQALYLIAQGEGNKVKGQLEGLVKRILPLLAMYAKENAAGLKQLISKLQEKIK